ncbi:MAG: phosphopentomutase [Nitrospira sp.]|nr:phosphopentomutase [Nitrospira sp.]
MIKRVLLFVIDGFGIGPLPDAAEYGDAEANTLVHLADAVGGLSLPNLEALGLGHLAKIAGVASMAQPHGCFGRLGFTGRGKDSVSGYWETNGVVVQESGAVYQAGIPGSVVAEIEQALGRKLIGHRVAPMSAMLRDYGAEHLSSGAPILWTDGGNACYVAAHEATMPVAVLHQQCREAWKAVKKTGTLMRIVAQPVTGEPGALRPKAGRKDFIAEPPGLTMLDALSRSGQITMGIGKVYDLFSGRGFTKSFPAASAFDDTVGMLNKVPRGLLYVSLDLLSEDSAQAAEALQDFDRRLPDLFEQLRVGDMVILTGDHGRDSSKPDKLPTREYVPVLITGPKLAQGVNLGTSQTAADLGQTIVDILGADRLAIGDSFWEALRPG